MNSPRLMGQIRDVLRVHHYSLRTEESCAQCIRRYSFFHNTRRPKDMAELELAQFLSHLATEKNVSAS